MGSCWRTEESTDSIMRVLLCLLILGSVMLMSCSAELEAQQLDGDLPHDGAEEVVVPADVQMNIIQEILGYISTAEEEAIEEEIVEEELVEEFTEEQFGLVGRFFRTLSTFTPGF